MGNVKLVQVTSLQIFIPLTGAVVAREYGLPCVVNVPGATHSFKSGDFVELDGTNGRIHRLENIS